MPHLLSFRLSEPNGERMEKSRCGATRLQSPLYFPPLHKGGTGCGLSPFTQEGTREWEHSSLHKIVRKPIPLLRIRRQ